MKKIKVNLMIIALLLGVAGAFVSKAANHKAKVGDDYYWFDPTGSTYVEENSTDGEQETNCPGKTNVCENGYLSSQLINGDPHQGVIPTQKGTPATTVKMD